ncbi:MAG: response regulator [Lachnospiraceae bacterium]|nr:response regulator [Lachnospiraceae bacterium]
MIKYICPQLLFAGFVLSLYYAFSHLKKKDLKNKENLLFVFFCLFSAIWSFGFYGVFIQTVPDKAYTWRAIGMIGTFGYLITAQLLICHFAGIRKIWRSMVETFSLTGIIIYFFNIQRDQVTYELTDIGMSYSFTPGLWNNLYIIYSIITAINMFCVTIYMLRRSSTRRMHALARKLLTAEFIILFGMLLDTIFPMIGMKAIPGSSIAQSIGLFIMYGAVTFASHSHITISNMSEFVYYSLTVPVLVYDANKKLQVLNDAAYPFVGIKKKERGDFDITGIDSLFHTDKGDIFDFEGNSQEADAICSHNLSYCSLSINKIYDDFDDTIGYIIIVTDLSERMNSMKRLEEAKRDAENANHAKSTFLANMSHEIRTPMNAIIGFSELVLKMNINEEVRSYVNDIKFSSHNLLAIINDILDISKIESGKMELVLDSYFTSQLLNDVSIIISPQAKQKGLAFETKIDQNIPRALYGDKVRIRSILINILNNAVKYTQEGSITFSASILKQTATHVTLKFEISDTGIGIKPENLENLFETFQRFDQKIHYGIEGSGLGLAISNGYINLMGGEIKVDSTYQKGSTFTVLLEQKIVDEKPLEQDYSQNAIVQNTTSISNMKLYGTSVLVADDNAINLRVAHGILSYYGLVVDTASSGMEALKLCQSKKYDFVFMDQMMPEMDGIEAMREVRKLNSHYAKGGPGKIIVLTADAIKGARETLIGQGFDEYLGKPINVSQLERLFVRYIPANKITYEDANDTSDSSGSSLSGLENKLMGIDVAMGISNCGGKFEDYLKILKITYDYGEKQLNELKEAFESKDYETYIIKIHSIKSTSLNIGATGISAMARSQEEEGRAGNYAYIDKHMQEFQDDYRTLLQTIKSLLIEHKIIASETDAEAEDMQELDEAMLLRLYKNIERCIDQFDFAKVFEILEEIKKYKVPDKHKKILTKLDTLMENLEVDAIKELLASIK